MLFRIEYGLNQMVVRIPFIECPAESAAAACVTQHQYAFSCTKPFHTVISMILKSSLSDQCWM